MERPADQFTGVRVFTATQRRDREAMGDNATQWLRANPHVHIVDWSVTQSSDREYHCLTLMIFYRE